MTDRTRHRLLFGVSAFFTAIGLLMLWTERDASSLFIVLFFGGCTGVAVAQLREGSRRVRNAWPELDGDTITLGREMWSMRFYGLAGIAMGLGSGVAAFTYPGMVERVIGVVGLLFFAGGGLYLLIVKGSGPSIALRVDKAGLSFGYGRHPRLRWHELENHGIQVIRGQKYLGFVARDPAQLMDGQSTLERIGARLGKPFGMADFAVGQVGIEVPLEAVVGAIARLRKRYS